jgi:hypothetical protein
MFQSGYKGITALSTNLPYMGGFCQWYFTPRENILAFPSIDPATQWLTTEPLLKTGATWFGPIKVPNDQLGFEETQNHDKRGIFYKAKASGFYPGDDALSRINLENMPYYEYVVVGKQRAGGLWMVLGDDQHGLDFDHDYKSSLAKGAGSNFSFTTESLTKGLILPSFLGTNTTPPVGSGTGGSGGGTGSTGDGANQKEIISFTNQSLINFTWTLARKTLFGDFPLIQVWTNTAGVWQKAVVPIFVDAPPPSTTTFTVNFSGNIESGIIVIE